MVEIWCHMPKDFNSWHMPKDYNSFMPLYKSVKMYMGDLVSACSELLDICSFAVEKNVIWTLMMHQTQEAKDTRCN